jgi:hypothetical protein
VPSRGAETGVYDEASELVVGILWLIIITCVDGWCQVGLAKGKAICTVSDAEPATQPSITTGSTNRYSYHRALLGNRRR